MMTPHIIIVFNIIVVDLPTTYGVFLGRDWSSIIKGYIMNDGSCMMLPRKEGVMIKVPREPRKLFPFKKKDNDLMKYYIDARIGNYAILDMEHGEILEKIQDTDNKEHLFEGYWRMSFDGACSRSRSGVGIVLVSPEKIMHPHAIRLEFPCTNNEAEYEALIQGMIIAQKMRIEHLIVTSDFELVINQVIQRYIINKERLKLYFKRVNELMEYFISFNISFIPRDKNQKVYSLALATSLSNPNDIQSKKSFQVERVFRPSVPDNLEYLQVFENDEQLEIVLLNDDDEENHISVVPKDCIQSESLFTKDDHAKNLLEEISLRKVQETRKINIGTDSSPKYVNQGVDCTIEEVDQYVSLFKQYLDVFSWTYYDLKSYDKTIF
jgi:ribonuclease HI